MIKIKSVCLILLLLCFWASCSVNVKTKAYINPPFDNTFIKTIAVIEFGNNSYRNGAGRIIADRVEQLLINESGYIVVSRMDVDKLILERNMDKISGIISSSTAQEIGKLLNLDALIVGNVENYEILSKKKAREIKIAALFKVIKVSDGRVVWSKSAYGQYLSPNKAKESEYEGFVKTIDNLLMDIRYLFPHERVQVERKNMLKKIF